MTLDTRMYVLDPINAGDLFRQAQAVLGKYDEQGRGPDQMRWTADGGCISNAPGQDLPGWLMLHHGDGAPYRTAEDAAVHECCNHPDADYYDTDQPACTDTEHSPVCWAEISIDTAYGYRGPDGMRCGDLHAAFVAEVGAWLDSQNIRWKWLNEFSGEVHDSAESLIELVSGGFEASAWFRTTVLPAIAGHISDERDGAR